ncbi:MAG: fatty acid desaturase family protein [Mycobacteriales bacterium]
MTTLTPVAVRGSDYAELSRRVRGAGLLDRRPRYYAVRLAALGVALGYTLLGMAVVGNSWYQLALAVPLALVFGQLAFAGHDVGHRQVFATRRAGEAAGLVLGNLLIGMSRGWWVDKHNRHHSHPNQVGHDPDIADGPITWTPEQTGARRGAGRVLARWQGHLFFPMLLLEGLNLHVASIRAVPGLPRRRRRAEALLLVAHAAWYLSLLLTVMSPVKALVFVAVHQGLFGVYLGCSFAPNHKGMPILDRDDNVDFLRRQVLTSRNVRGGPAVDLALGGLNYQVEHHLFPSMPMPNLRRAQPIVRAYCAEQGIPYHETGLVDSYRQALAHLRDVGREH